MNKQQREHVLDMLFGSTLSNLDTLREKGMLIPSEVYLQLGMLQGNVSGIMDHIDTNHTCAMHMLRRRLQEYEDVEDTLPALGDEEPAPEDVDEQLTHEDDEPRMNVVRIRADD